MEKTTLNTVVTLRNEVSPWLIILQVVPDGWNFSEYVRGSLLSWVYSVRRPAALLPARNSPRRFGEADQARYGIASSPVNREFLEFSVALVPSGALTPRLFDLKMGDRIWLSQRAAGKFSYDDSKVPKGANLVLITTGSGLSGR